MKTFKSLLIIFSLFCSQQLLASYVATITGLYGNATVIRDTQTINATLGLQLEEKDTVQTLSHSKLQIIFKDETIVSLGHNSNFSIKEYLFEDKSEPIAKFGMLEGAIQTITGKIGKIAPEKFTLITKTATIGIRGTNFTTIMKENNLNVYCTYGAISVTMENEIYTIDQGYLLDITANGKISKKEFSAKDLKKMRKENFKENSKIKTIAQKEQLIENNQNETHLNVTIKDDMNIVIQDVTETISDTILTPKSDILTDETIISSYTMQYANYMGSYTTTINNTSLSSSGDAFLSVNFAQNTAWLELGNFENQETSVMYDIYDIDSNRFTGVELQEEGITEGAFYGATGNVVNGTFTHTEFDGEVHQTTYGNYNVVSTQTLH